MLLFLSSNRLSCQNSELLYKIAGLALQCELPKTVTIGGASLMSQLFKYFNFLAEIGDFTAQRCGLTYVSDFELIPVLVSGHQSLVPSIPANKLSSHT